MTQGGFCDTHGPYDSPHTACPYCVREGLIPAPNAGTPVVKATAWEQLQGTMSIPPDGDRPQPGGDFQHLPDDQRENHADEDNHPASQPPQVTTYLIVKSPIKYRGRVFRVEPGYVIGRRGADVLINDRRVSRQHARINFNASPHGDPPIFSIFDFGTPNGTFVNDEPIIGRAIITENDEIRMGDHVFVFKTLRR